MERPITYEKGDIIVVPFDFSNKKESKRRPALIIATPEGKDVIIAAITSKKPKNVYGIKITENDFKKGNLKLESYVKTQIIATIETTIIIKKIGTITKEKLEETHQKIIKLLT